MKEKKIIPHIDLDSIQFREKVILSFEEADGVTTTIPSPGGRKEEVNNLIFLLLNSKSSNRKYCSACNAFHWHFVKEFEEPDYKDTACLCMTCGNLLPLMVLLGADEKICQEWMVSKGDIDPFTILRDRIDIFIKEGKIKVWQEDIQHGT